MQSLSTSQLGAATRFGGQPPARSRVDVALVGHGRLHVHVHVHLGEREGERQQ